MHARDERRRDLLSQPGLSRVATRDHIPMCYMHIAGVRLPDNQTKKKSLRCARQMNVPCRAAQIGVGVVYLASQMHMLTQPRKHEVRRSRRSCHSRFKVSYICLSKLLPCWFLFFFFCFDHDEIKKKRTRHDQLAIGIILVVGMTQDDVWPSVSRNVTCSDFVKYRRSAGTVFRRCLYG